MGSVFAFRGLPRKPQHMFSYNIPFCCCFRGLQQKKASLKFVLPRQPLGLRGSPGATSRIPRRLVVPTRPMVILGIKGPGESAARIMGPSARSPKAKPMRLPDVAQVANCYLFFGLPRLLFFPRLGALSPSLLWLGGPSCSVGQSAFSTHFDLFRPFRVPLVHVSWPQKVSIEFWFQEG